MSDNPGNEREPYREPPTGETRRSGGGRKLGVGGTLRYLGYGALLGVALVAAAVTNVFDRTLSRLGYVRADNRQVETVPRRDTGPLDRGPDERPQGVDPNSASSSILEWWTEPQEIAGELPGVEGPLRAQLVFRYSRSAPDLAKTSNMVGPSTDPTTMEASEGWQAGVRLLKADGTPLSKDELAGLIAYEQNLAQQRLYITFGEKELYEGEKLFKILKGTRDLGKPVETTNGAVHARPRCHRRWRLPAGGRRHRGCRSPEERPPQSAVHRRRDEGHY